MDLRCSNSQSTSATAQAERMQMCISAESNSGCQMRDMLAFLQLPTSNSLKWNFSMVAN